MIRRRNRPEPSRGTTSRSAPQSRLLTVRIDLVLPRPLKINQAPKYIIQRVKLEQSWRDTQAKTLSEAN